MPAGGHDRLGPIGDDWQFRGHRGRPAWFWWVPELLVARRSGGGWPVTTVAMKAVRHTERLPEFDRRAARTATAVFCFR